MVALRTALTRQMKAFVAVLAAMVIAMTSLVVAAPSANAAYRLTCVVSKRVVHRGAQDAVLCRHGAKLHRGRAYVLRKRSPHFYRLKVFRTGKRGNALFSFRVKRGVHLGRVRVHVQVGGKRTSFLIVVHPRRHRRG
jgi:hypothetical protein